MSKLMLNNDDDTYYYYYYYYYYSFPLLEALPTSELHSSVLSIEEADTSETW